LQKKKRASNQNPLLFSHLSLLVPGKRKEGKKGEVLYTSGCAEKRGGKERTGGLSLFIVPRTERRERACSFSIRLILKRRDLFVRLRAAVSGRGGKGESSPTHWSSRAESGKEKEGDSCLYGRPGGGKKKEKCWPMGFSRPLGVSLSYPASLPCERKKGKRAQVHSPTPSVPNAS